MNSEHNNCTALNFTKTTVWSCSCFNGQWIGPIVEIYLKYLLCLWISRSNFVNASQEKFSPVSKVLHRIQNKFPDSQSATVCQIFFLHLYLAFLLLKNKNRWSMLNTVKEKFDFCFAGFWVEHFTFCQFWWRTRCRAFCRRSWNGFPLIYDRWPPSLLRSNARLKSNRPFSFFQQIKPQKVKSRRSDINFVNGRIHKCGLFAIIYQQAHKPRKKIPQRKIQQRKMQ